MRKPTRIPGLVVIVGLIAGGIGATGFLIERLAGGDAQAPRAQDPTARPGKDPDFDGLFRAGVERLREGRAHAAVRTFEKARQRRPHVPEVYINLGFAYLALKVPDAARQAFAKAIDLRPEQPNAYFGLAESFEQLDDLEMALGAMRTYIHLTAENDAYRRRAMAAVWEWQSRLKQKPARSDASTPPSGPIVPGAAPAPGADAAGTSPERLAGLSLQRLDGGADTLTHYTGKTLILNIWATWCPPCRKELPALQRLSERLNPDLFAVAGLSIDKDADFVREFLREVGVSYVNYIDATQDVAKALTGIVTVPQTVVIGPDGMIRQRIEGYRDWDDPQVVAQLEGRQ
ncbi:MAG: redoxin family protein [Rhodospirillales bacterium]